MCWLPPCRIIQTKLYRSLRENVAVKIVKRELNCVVWSYKLEWWSNKKRESGRYCNFWITISGCQKQQFMASNNNARDFRNCCNESKIACAQDNGCLKWMPLHPLDTDIVLHCVSVCVSHWSCNHTPCYNYNYHYKRTLNASFSSACYDDYMAVAAAAAATDRRDTYIFMKKVQQIVKWENTEERRKKQQQPHTQRTKWRRSTTTSTENHIHARALALNEYAS